MTIYQADEYVIPFTIKHNNEVLTPSRVYDVSIVIGDIKKTYSDSSLGFDTSTNQWLFYISKEQTAKMIGTTEAQIEIAREGSLFHSAIIAINVAKSVKPFVQGVN